MIFKYNSIFNIKLIQNLTKIKQLKILDFGCGVGVWSQNNLKNWDSVNHMNLILAIEKEFDITLDNNDVVKLSDFKSCFQLIKNKLIL